MNSLFSFDTFPTLTTTRLRIRKLVETDSKAIFNMRNNAAINKYIKRTPPKTVDEAFAFINRINADFKNKKNIFWGIECTETSKIIGAICLWRLSEDGSYAEIGYELLPIAHKKGLMTEAIQKVIDFGFKTAGFKTIEAFTHKENTSSKALLEKNGFTLQANKVDKGFPNNIIYKIQTA